MSIEDDQSEPALRSDLRRAASTSPGNGDALRAARGSFELQLQAIAEHRGRAKGANWASDPESEDSVMSYLASNAATEVADIPPKPRVFFRPAVWWTFLAMGVSFSLAGVVANNAPDSPGGALLGWLTAVLFFAAPIVGARGEKKDRVVYLERVAWLSKVFLRAAESEIRERVKAELERREQAEAERLAVIMARPTPPPTAQPYGVSPRGAEQIVCEWMRHLGALDAEVTDYSGDGGIDVISENWIAQVKHYQGSVGVQAVRELAGVAAVDGRDALFFTSTGYATGASEFADRARIALFVYSVEDATLSAANSLGARFLSEGLGARDE